MKQDFTPLYDLYLAILRERAGIAPHAEGTLRQIVRMNGFNTHLHWDILHSPEAPHPGYNNTMYSAVLPDNINHGSWKKNQL